MNMAHGFLIRPQERDIIPVLHNADDYKEIYKHIDCDCFDVVRIDDAGNVIFVDDEGLLKDQRHYFHIGDTTLTGKGLVLGTNAEGDTVSTTLTLGQLQDMISFSERKLLGFEVIEGMTMLHGKPAFGIQSIPIFGDPEPIEDKK